MKIFTRVNGFTELGQISGLPCTITRMAISSAFAPQHCCNIVLEDGVVVDATEPTTYHLDYTYYPFADVMSMYSSRPMPPSEAPVIALASFWGIEPQAGVRNKTKEAEEQAIHLKTNRDSFSWLLGEMRIPFKEEGDTFNVVFNGAPSLVGKLGTELTIHFKEDGEFRYLEAV